MYEKYLCIRYAPHLSIAQISSLRESRHTLSYKNGKRSYQSDSLIPRVKMSILTDMLSSLHLDDVVCNKFGEHFVKHFVIELESNPSLDGK